MVQVFCSPSAARISTFLYEVFMDSSTNLKQVGEVIETLIHIKDSLYSELTFEQKVSLEDACNLLSHHLGDFTKYDWQYNLKVG